MEIELTAIKQTSNTREQVKALRDMNKILHNMNINTSNIQTSPISSPVTSTLSQTTQRLQHILSPASLPLSRQLNPSSSPLQREMEDREEVDISPQRSPNRRSSSLDKSLSRSQLFEAESVEFTGLREKYEKLKQDNEKKREQNEYLKEQVCSQELIFVDESL